MEDIYSLWRYLQEKFKESLSKVSYDTWIDSAVPVRLTETNIIIEVPSSLHKDYWQNNLATRVVEGIYEFTNNIRLSINCIEHSETLFTIPNIDNTITAKTSKSTILPSPKDSLIFSIIDANIINTKIVMPNPTVSLSKFIKFSLI